MRSDTQPFVLMEPLASLEARTVSLGLALSDDFTPQPVRCRREDLLPYASDLRNAIALPVGSVEFVRAAADIAQRPLPRWSPYPPELSQWLGRRVAVTTAGVAIKSAGCFVKPVETKRFNGFVLAGDMREQGEHDQEQFEILQSMPAHEPVWVSEVVAFQSEWRFYLDGYRQVGKARYDPDGHEDAARPDPAVVLAMVSAAGVRHPHSIDVGVLESGETVLVEAHDFYALGLYGRCVEPGDYLRLLWSRWRGHVLESARCEVEADASA